MKKNCFAVALACLALSAPAFADMPRMFIEDAESPYKEPMAANEANKLAVALRFSQKQQMRVERVIRAEIDEPVQDLIERYNERKARIWAMRDRLNDIQFQLFQLKTGFSTELRSALGKEQKEKFDKLVYDGYFSPYPKAPPKVEADGVQVTDKGDYIEERRVVMGKNAAGKTVRRTIITRRKKVATSLAEKAEAKDAAPIIEEPPAGAYP